MTTRRRSHELFEHAIADDIARPKVDARKRQAAYVHHCAAAGWETLIYQSSRSEHRNVAQIRAVANAVRELPSLKCQPMQRRAATLLSADTELSLSVHVYCSPSGTTTLDMTTRFASFSQRVDHSFALP